MTRGLYEKLGLKRESIRIGAASGMLSTATEFSPEDWDRLNAELDRVYRQFTTLAAQDRAMDHEHLESLARGRVWSGADACERGWWITSGLAPGLAARLRAGGHRP